jgi:hypothetical protein
MADSNAIGSMTALPTAEFEISWLKRERSLDEHFKRDVRRTLVDGDDAERFPELVAEFRTLLATERAAVDAVWRDGDELWEWRNERWAPKFEPTDSIGEMGIAVLRAGSVIAAWMTGTWA